LKATHTVFYLHIYKVNLSVCIAKRDTVNGINKDRKIKQLFLE